MYDVCCKATVRDVMAFRTQGLGLEAWGVGLMALDSAITLPKRFIQL